MASIKCGNCKQYHEGVAEVRACYAGRYSQPTLNAPEMATRQPGETPGFYESPVDRIKSYAKRLPNVATAYYAITEDIGTDNNPDTVWAFYRVDRPQEGRWAGYTFVKQQAGDDLFPIKKLGRVASILQSISFDPQSASEDYGRQLGHCGICARSLTNAESRARGIGPVCAEKVGW